MRGALFLLILWPVLALGSVPDAPPPPVTLTAGEQSTVDKGRVVVRTSSTSTGGMVTGVVDVKASPEAVWAALFDFEARVDEIGALNAVSIYQDDAEALGARWELRIFGTSIVFHNLYKRDPENGWSRYALDPARTNDLVTVEGAYQVYAHGDGTRLVYRSMTDSGRAIPAFIKNWLGGRSLTSQLEGIRRRAEGSP